MYMWESKNIILFVLIAVLVGMGFSVWEKPTWIKTYYTLLCAGSTVSYCTIDDIETAKLTYLEIDKKGQKIISWDKEGVNKRWEDCIIANKSNWGCNTERETIQSGNGEITYLSYPYDPKDLRLLYIKKSEYWLAKIKLWFKS
ncbi:MAG: hypothetical protein G01um101417_341 [Parcubacteria group bacterium Gr01-1014_17]|nr:MAG: hypothetical protein G01um101417_341 [Parcubacteria group bacterium Gr01-1014_17]